MNWLGWILFLAALLYHAGYRKRQRMVIDAATAALDAGFDLAATLNDQVLQLRTERDRALAEAQLAKFQAFIYTTYVN